MGNRRNNGNAFRHTDTELLTMMAELKVAHNVNFEELRKAFFKQIKEHHSDKGGKVEKAQKITEAFRVLKFYLDNDILLPQPRQFGNPPPATNFGRSGCRTNAQGPRSAGDGFEDFGDFEEVKKKKGKRGGRGNGNQNRQENNGNGRNEQNGDRGGATEKTKTPPKFINGYTYDEDDYSKYDDPMEKPDRQKDCLRRIRGGLTLYKDFQRGLMLPEQYSDFGTKYSEEDLLNEPEFEDIRAKLRIISENLNEFAEKIRTFVYVSWAFDGGASNDARIVVKNVKMERFVQEEELIYEIKIQEKNFDEDILTTGLHVDVSTTDNRMWANAVIEDVKPESHSIIVFFVDSLRLSRILNQSSTVNIAINCSAFVYRSQLRSIECIENSNYGRDMAQILFPKPNFTEQYAEFIERRAKELESMPFRREQGDDNEHNEYNVEQKNAIYSIVDKSHRQWPFILFGPPGTGKTITLVEAIRHLVHQSSQNRILVCTPSRHAADNFAEALLQHKFLDNKYIFRMHSLSTSSHKRNKILDPISYLAKEAKHRFFGIPDRHNLKMFRVIISTLATSSYLVSAGGLRGYFTHLFIDEAGQALESEILIPLGGLVGPQTSVILAGDPKQLGPVMNVIEMKWFGFDNSLLKRIMESEYYEEGEERKSDDRFIIRLRQTYRSHYFILRPCSYLFYNNKLIVDDSQGIFHELAQWEGLPKKGFPIIFHSSKGSRDEQGIMNKSYHNDFEAKWVCVYVERLLNETGLAQKDIGVISPYKNQVHKLRQYLSAFSAITVDSVEGFQGSERQVIIMSTVRQREMGFLRCDLRLNTSISRAKYLLIVIGNNEVLSQHETWKKFIYYCRHHGAFVDSSGQKIAEIEYANESNGDPKNEYANESNAVPKNEDANESNAIPKNEDANESNAIPKNEDANESNAETDEKYNSPTPPDNDEW